MEYVDVYERIVAEARSIVGDVAVTQADRIEGVTVDAEGMVTAERELGKEDIEELIDTYRDIIGDGAVGIGRRAVTALEQEDREGLKNLDLPVDILPSDIKADLFAESF